MRITVLHWISASLWYRKMKIFNLNQRDVSTFELFNNKPIKNKNNIRNFLVLIKTLKSFSSQLHELNIYNQALWLESRVRFQDIHYPLEYLKGAC